MPDLSELSKKFLNSVLDRATQPGWLFLTWVLATVSIGEAIGRIGPQIDAAISWPASAALGAAVAWMARQSALPPRIQKGKLGISFAVATELASDERKIELDLVSDVRRIVDSYPAPVPFQVQMIPSRLVATGMTRQEAEKLLFRTRSRFLLYGDLRKRKSGGRDVYSLRFEGLASHALTTSENSQLLGTDMRSVLPLNLNIDCDRDLEGFQVTAEQIANSAAYIVAVTYFLSGAVKEAARILEALQTSSPKIVRNPLPLSQELLKLVPKRLCEFQVQYASELYFQWRTSHAPSLMGEIEQIVLQLPPESLQRADVRNLRAICAFVLRRDVATTRLELQECQRIDPRNPIWSYSLAFLAAYEGDLDSAHRLYRRAFNSDTSAHLTVEVEEFVAWCAEVDKDRSQLYYCLGYINGRQKKDAERAIADFERFIQTADPAVYERRIELAGRYIRRLKAGEWINA